MQNFPDKPIRLISAAAAGGSIDLLCRLLAQGISAPLGQPVTVENRGTGGADSGDYVAHAAPDGSTLLVVAATLWTAPLLQKVPYDPVKDFAPVTLAVTQPNILVVPASLPVKSVAELIAMARARPGELSYGSGLTGAPSHLAGALFTYMAGLNMGHVPYKNTAQLGINDLIAGKVQMMIFSAGSATPHIKSGKVRALAVTSARPSALFPDLPPIAATLPGYEAAQPLGILAPAKTSTTVIQRLNQEMVRFLKTPETVKQFMDAGIEVIASTPEEFAAYIKSDTENMSKVISAGNIKSRGQG